MVNKEQPKFTEEQVAAAEEQIVEQSKRIEFYITEYTVELLVLKIRNGDFEVPAYHRGFTWNQERKSRFIESVFMGLPTPSLFFWESPTTGRLQIVDGVQRVRTLEEFVFDDFALGELDELPLLTGFRFKDLLSSRQRKFMNRSIRGSVLNEYTDEQARLDLFMRLNVGSKIINTTEARRGLLGGSFLDLVISLSQEQAFIKLAPVSETQRREQEREELVTRFFAYSDGLEGYKDRVSTFLFDYTKKMNAHFEQKPEDLAIYRQRFMDTMEFVSRNFPWGFRRTPKGATTPRARFEAIAIGSYLAIQEQPEIAKKWINVEDWLRSKEFIEVTGADSVSAISNLRIRINFVRDRLLGE
jgi:hypothetical protein